MVEQLTNEALLAQMLMEDMEPPKKKEKLKFHIDVNRLDPTEKQRIYDTRSAFRHYFKEATPEDLNAFVRDLKMIELEGKGLTDSLDYLLLKQDEAAEQELEALRKKAQRVYNQRKSKAIQYAHKYFLEDLAGYSVDEILDYYKGGTSPHA